MSILRIKELLSAMRLTLITLLMLVSGLAFSQSEAEEAVGELILGNYSRFELVGPKLRSRIDSLSALSEKCEVSVLEGDAQAPTGDGKASHHAVVGCGVQGGGLGLRLNSLGEGKFGVLGFWSIPGA